MLYPKHYVELSMLPHIDDQQRKDEIHNIAKLTVKGIEKSSTDLSFLNIYPRFKSSLQFFKHLQHHRDSRNNRRFLKLSRIFGPYENKDGFSFIPNMIIIEGAPGMGKTTLCKEIAYQWANNQNFTDHKVILFISLCNPVVNQIKDIRSLIQHFYSLDVEILERYLIENSKKVTIIFDGYDEFSDNGDESIIIKILNRKILTECKIIITSRHTASYKLLNQDKTDAYVRVEILGFTKEGREQYIQQELSDPKKVSKLQSYLDSHPSIETVCYIPMMMTILVYVFKQKEELPADSTNLYETLVAFAICRFYQKLKSVKRFTTLQDMPQECKTYLISLSKFAFLALQKHQTVFSEEDVKSLCPNSPLTVSGLDGLGLVKITQYFSVELPDEQDMSGEPKMPDKRVYNFLNLSIQEYLAAYFLKYIDQSRQFETLKDTFFSSQYSHMWKMFIRMNKQKWITFKCYSLYFSGIDDTTVKQWINSHTEMTLFDGFMEFNKFICQKKYSVQLFCFKTNKEAKSDFSGLYYEQQKLYLALNSGGTAENNLFEIFVFGCDIHTEWLAIANALVNAHNFAVTIVSNFSFQSYKSKHNNLISSFKIKNLLCTIALEYCYITDKVVKSVVNCCSKSEYLEDVFINNCYFLNKHGLREIINVLSNKLSLSSIKIVDTIVDEESVKPLASTIRNNVNLQILQLINISLQTGIKKIIYAIENITTLKGLSITHSTISPAVSDRLATALQSNHSLIALDLANNKLKASANVILQCISMIISQLRLLNLEGNHMPKEAGEALESVINNNPGIEILLLNDNNLSDGALKVARALKSLTSLKTLNLGNNNLPGSIMNELSQVFMSNKCLEKLSLSDNKLKSSIFCVLESLSTISKLSYLNVRGNQISEEAGDLLASAIQKNKGALHTLLLGNNYIEKGIMQIVKALQQVTSLKMLDLANNNIPEEVCNELAIVINSNNHLEKLVLQGNKLHSSAITILRSLSNISSLEALDLQGCELNETTAKFIASVVLNNKRLKALCLQNNNITNGMALVVKAFQNIKSLKLLELGNNGIPEEVCKELALVIDSNTHLEQLWLQGNKLHASASTILQSLSHISNVRALNMDNNQIGERGGEVLASVIIRNIGLKELHFASNNLHKSFIKISQALQNISTLTSLDLSDNNIPWGAGSEVAAVIQSNNSLKQLKLHSNNLRSSIVVILEALSKLSTLELLDLHSSHLTAVASNGLHNVIVNNMGLQSLCINDNNIGRGLIIILKALKSISSLTELNISNNNFMNDMMIALRVTNKVRMFLESFCKCSHYSNSSEILFLKKLCIVSKSHTMISIVEEAEINLASTLQSNPRLNVLHVDNGCLSEVPKHFTKALKYVNSIKTLDLNNFSLSTEIVSELASSIKSYTCLEEIFMHNSNLKLSVIILSEALTTISTLKVLDLQSNGLTEETGESLASVISNNLALETLFLDNNNIGVGALKIAKALQNIKCLRLLGLSSNSLPKDIVHKLSTAIKSNSYLQLLTLSSNDLRSSAIVILQSLSSIATLKVLNINNNHIGEEAGEALASVIIHNTGMEKLYLSDNNLGYGILKVAKALQHITSLKLLDLGNNNIPKEVSGEIALAIKSNGRLENLSLNNNNLESSAIAILQALGAISTLNGLAINGNQITKDAGEALASVVIHNTGIANLHLSDNNLGDGILEVAKALQHITSFATHHIT